MLSDEDVDEVIRPLTREDTMIVIAFLTEYHWVMKSSAMAVDFITTVHENDGCTIKVYLPTKHMFALAKG